ncbi:MAG: N-acetylglucosamine-6-phosphate deacetylase [Candidatus Marinimicrobia bacterium]|nr:N-acetylglucosamine-6-phosphate deacetylase [Candidatus Neomarinimicrobiota bacterium]
MTEIFEGQLVLPENVRYGQVVIKEGRIDTIHYNPEDFLTPTVKVPDDQYICPGFVDIQINGAFGKEFKSDVDAVEVIRTKLPKFGTTSFCPTVTTRPLDTYQDHVETLMQRVGTELGAKIIGMHLEGPFLNPSKVGAQNAALLHNPIDCPYEKYATEHIEIVTISPELEGSKEFIDRLIADGKKVGVGHSLIDYKELIDLFDSNNMMIVHVFNAMADLNSRKPGVVGAALEKDEYFVSLIADGIHVDPVTVRIFWKSKTDKKKVICITDGSAVSGMDVGIHKIGSRSIEKREDRAVLEGTETLVGSTLTLNVAARNLKAFTNCSLNEAINAVSLNPATYLGRQDEIGQLKAGNAADIVVIDNEFEVKHTYVDGILVLSNG